MFIFGEVPPPFFRGTEAKFPDYDIVSLDDEQVKSIMLHLGLTHLFNDRSESNVVYSMVYKDHPTHWLLFTRFENFPQSSDNGFTLNGWLKSKYDLKAMAGLVVDFTRPEGGPLGPALGPVKMGVLKDAEN